MENSLKSSIKNKSKKQKKVLAFSRKMCYYIEVVRRRYPGVAKFGIALEWGSRGLEFESRHSDQIMGSFIWNFPLFISVERNEDLNASVRRTLA